MRQGNYFNVNLYPADPRFVSNHWMTDYRTGSAVVFLVTRQHAHRAYPFSPPSSLHRTHETHYPNIESHTLKDYKCKQVH